MPPPPPPPHYPHGYPQPYLVWNGWVHLWNGREWVPQYPAPPPPYHQQQQQVARVKDTTVCVQHANGSDAEWGRHQARFDASSSFRSPSAAGSSVGSSQFSQGHFTTTEATKTNKPNQDAQTEGEKKTASKKDASTQRRTKKRTKDDRVERIHDELINQNYSGDFDAITPIILKEGIAHLGGDQQPQPGASNEKQKRRRLGGRILRKIVKRIIRDERLGKMPLAGASASRTTSNASTEPKVGTNAVTDDDDAAQPDSESEIDPHAGLISPRGVDADVATIGSHNKSDVEDSKMPADQVVSSVNVSASSTNDDKNDDDEEHNDDAVAVPPAPVSLPPPPFDSEHLQIIGGGIHQRKVVQADVGNVGKTGASGSLLYLPPKSWSTDHNMHPLKDAKIVLRTRFKGISNEVVGGEKRIRSLGKVDCSSDLYDTLILSTEDDKGTSVALWKSVEEGRSWFISWLAVNVRCERKGYPTYLLRCIRDLARGFGVDHIYLEVGKSSTIRDGGEWEGVKTFYRKLGFSEAGDDVPDGIKACCQELGFGTHEILKWDLNKRKLRARR